MPTPHRSIEAFPIYNFKDEYLSEDVPGLKLRPGQLRQLLENLPAMLTEPDDFSVHVYQAAEEQWSINISPIGEGQIEIDYNEGIDGISETPYRIAQPSEVHRRSYVIEHPDFLQKWDDEYGNTYGAVTLKGNNFSNPKIIEHPNASTGYIPYGQQESYIMERVLRASNAIRAAGISTEYIIGLAQPKRFPWPLFRTKDKQDNWLPANMDGHTMLGLKEYKRRMVDDKWSSMPDDERTIEALIDLTNKFEDMRFYTTARAMDTQFRVGDMTNKEILGEVFEMFNQHYRSTLDDMPVLDPTKRADIDSYFERFLMPKLGANFAKLHTMGLAHRFANSLNLTALGGIVDLDSVHGEPLNLGDEPITHRDMVLDIVDALSDIWTRYIEIRLVGDEIDPDDMPKNCIMQFMIQYFDKTIEGIGDEEKAKGYLARVLMELQWLTLDPNRMSGQLKPFIQEVATACYFVFFHKTDMLKVKEEISDLIASVCESFDTIEMRERIKNELRKEVGQNKEQIMTMLHSDITRQYMAGEALDVLALLFGSNSVGAMLMKGQLFESVSHTILADAIGDMFRNKYHELGLHGNSEDSILWQFFKSVEQSHIFEVIHEVDEATMRGLVTELYMEFGASLGYRIPESILKNEGKPGIFGMQPGMSFAENELWILSQGVPYTVLEDLIKDDVQTKDDYSTTVIADSQARFAITTRRDGYHVAQIVTDGKLKTLTFDENDSDVMHIEFNQDDRPIYLLIAEENESGERRVTKLYDSDQVSEFLKMIIEVGGVRADAGKELELFSVETNDTTEK